MSLIIDKLRAAGIPDAVITTLEEKFGTSLIDEIQKNGLKMVAEKAGIDPKKLPDIDFSHLMEMGEDMLGKRDSDGDGKTGLAEIADTMGDMADKVGLTSAIDAVKNVVSEAQSVDVNKDGKTGALEAISQAKDSLLESNLGKKASEAAGSLFSKIKGFVK